MSVSSPDLPDFETLTSPTFVTIGATGIGQNANVLMAQPGGNFRLWQVYMSGSYSALAAFAGGGAQQEARLVDGAGNLYGTLNFDVRVANNIQNATISIPFYGIIVATPIANPSLTLTTDATVTNTMLRVNAGVVYSFP